MSDVKVSVCGKLKKFREDKNLNQEELGSEIGVSGSAISNYERGIRSMDYALLEKAAKVLDVSPSEFLSDPKKQIDYYKKVIEMQQKYQVGSSVVIYERVKENDIVEGSTGYIISPISATKENSIFKGKTIIYHVVRHIDGTEKLKGFSKKHSADRECEEEYAMELACEVDLGTDTYTDSITFPMRLLINGEYHFLQVESQDSIPETITIKNNEKEDGDSKSNGEKAHAEEAIYNRSDIILKNLTENELQVLSKNTDISRLECQNEAEKLKMIHSIKGIREAVDYDELGFIQTDTTLTELSEGNAETARLLITALERDEDFGDFKDEILNSFLFENEDHKEDKLRKDIIKQLIKECKETAGYSNEDYEKYGFSADYIDALENGRIKLTRDVYQMLRNVKLHNSLPFYIEKRVLLPIEMLSEESRKYLIYCEKNSKDVTLYGEIPLVAHVEGKGFAPCEMYIAQTDYVEHIENGKARLQYENYTCEEIRKCFERTIKHGCSTIVFLCDEPWYYYTHPNYRTVNAIRKVRGFEEKLNILLPD